MNFNGLSIMVLQDQYFTFLHAIKVMKPIQFNPTDWTLWPCSYQHRAFEQKKFPLKLSRFKQKWSY